MRVWRIAWRPGEWRFGQSDGVARITGPLQDPARDQALWARAQAGKAGGVRQGQAPRSLQPVMLMR
ncbi:MAG: hypothetical protein EBY24_15040 [Betaproteobacteria bacterium]|nr:hypothetical protein [Betaproteobacteria bacterium]